MSAPHRPVTGILLLTLSAAAGVAGGAEADDLRKANAELRRRVERLEREVRVLKELVLGAKPAPPSDGADPAGEKPPAGLSEADRLRLYKELAREMSEKAGKGPSVWSSLDIKLYGYVKLDAAYDSARTDVGNFARWVLSEQGRDNDSQYNMTAKQTRLGLEITGPEDRSVKTSGRVEIDFYGSAAENKAEPMMRHAYMKLDWPAHRFSILAGQTWDVISPLNPSTLNYSVQWWAGNIGYRRPQIRLTKAFRLGRDVDVTLEAAAARTIGLSGDFTPGDAGEDNCYPGVQGRVAVSFPFLGAKPTVVGFSGHYAREEYDTDASDSHRFLDSWSANLDVTQPITTWLTVKGELFTGENLSAYLGGIGQGVDAGTLREIRSCGGWAAASLGPWEKWRFNFGASVEAVHGGDVTDAAARTLNRSLFGNAIYEIVENASVGVEVSHWHTEYKGRGDGDSLRLQLSFLYKF